MRKNVNWGHDDQEAESAHGQRPWVWFMVDCFMLITSFFLLQFKFKVDEVILPQRLPPSGGYHTGPVATDLEWLTVHCTRTSGAPAYQVLSRTCSASDLTETLAALASNKHRLGVRVSYDTQTPWEDVMAVFNECSKLAIRECGLVPLRK